MIITPLKHAHLGDLVNILQIYPNVEQICFNGLCPCGCKQDTFVLLNQLVSLFEKEIKVSDKVPENAKKVYPIWSQDFKHFSGTLCYYNKPYVKAKNLPNKKDHIACQFDYRSKYTPWFKGVFDLSPIINRYKKKLINIGDQKIEGIQNCIDLDLKEKFDILASSNMYIGIDSGLSHLALMTNSSCFICHENKCPWFFYPKGPVFINMSSKEELSSLLKKSEHLFL